MCGIPFKCPHISGKWDYVWLGEFGEVANFHWDSFNRSAGTPNLY